MRFMVFMLASLLVVTQASAQIITRGAASTGSMPPAETTIIDPPHVTYSPDGSALHYGPTKRVRNPDGTQTVSTTSQIVLSPAQKAQIDESMSQTAKTLNDTYATNHPGQHFTPIVAGKVPLTSPEVPVTFQSP